MRRIITALLAACAVVATVLGGARANAASGSTLLLGLNGVSCSSATFCAAVGSQGDSAHPARGDVPLTMIWNGSRWRKTATPLPKGWTEGELDSLSCRSARYCVAIGEYNRGSYQYPLAETWNGGAWTAAKPPRAAGGLLAVRGAVSCGAARNCVAVMSFYSAAPSTHGYAEILRGGTWALRKVPLPKSASGGGFSDVSCVSAAYCVLSGGYARAGRGLVLFASWNGKSFTLMKAPSPPNLFVSGVSCPSAKRCAAIGSAGAPVAGPANASYAELWNGTAWSVVGVPPRKGLGTDLLGVSCGSAANCAAVGVASKDGSEQTSQAVADVYDGRSWTPRSVPALPRGGTSQFQGVSCASVSFCAAVGEGGGPGGNVFSSAALTGFWNGKSWRLVTAS